MNEMAGSVQKSVVAIGEITSDLAHPLAIGRGIIREISTLRLFRSMTKSTKYRINPDRVITSTLKKSVAAIAPQWAFRNVFHDIPFFSIGSNPFSRRIRLIVFRAISCPRLWSAPRIRVYPQRGLSRAIKRTSSSMSASVLGRPGFRFLLPSYFLAISSRCQRSRVSGVTRVLISNSSFRLIALALSASLRRCRSVNLSRFPPSCSRSARFSSWRYSITSCWCRLTQPAKISIRNCSGRAFISPSSGQRCPERWVEIADLVLA